MVDYTYLWNWGFAHPRLAGLAAFLGLYLMVGYGSEFLCNFIGFLYPAYASVKAIETHDKDDDTKWLTYWVIFSTFSLLEFFTDIFLFWIPFYSFLKCLFLLYCMVPTKWNGSQKIYHTVIKPIFLKHQKKVDETLDRMADTAQHVLDEGTDIIGDAAAQQMKDNMRDASKLE